MAILMGKESAKTYRVTNANGEVEMERAAKVGDPTDPNLYRDLDSKFGKTKSCPPDKFKIQEVK